MEHYIPVKIHIREQRATFAWFGAQWTPTLVVLDSGGTERHRWEGFLPKDDYLAQLELGLAKVALAEDRFTEAGEHFRGIVERHPAAGAAPEGLYWSGVAAYKASDNPADLKKTAQALQDRYPHSEWTTKASVWLP